MTNFEIKKYLDDDYVLIKTETYDPPIDGLPSSHSQFISLTESEMEDLLMILLNKVLFDENAN